MYECFEAQVVTRKYEAVAKKGNLKIGETKNVVVYLFEDKNHNVYISNPTKGKRCETNITCLKEKNNYAYLDISLVTGRRNQIRLSLSNMNMPIVGDTKYNGEKAIRMKLNAYALEFPNNLGLSKTQFRINKIFENEFSDESDKISTKYDKLLNLI